MGSPCEIRAYPERDVPAMPVLQQAKAEVERLEARYSRYREDSALSRINAAGGSPLRVDDETAGLLSFAEQAWKQSDGLFDPTAGVLREVWDFAQARLPQSAALEAVLPRIGWDRLDWQPPYLRLPAGMQLDFGGFVKEYAADAAMAVMRRGGLGHGLVNLGGDISVLGPHPDGRPWQLGVRHPRKPDQPIAQLALGQGGLASSGDYERYCLIEGQRYCHILHPRTGWPVQGLAAVSVVAPQCLLAGVAATVAMLKSPGQAREWLEQLDLPFLAVTRHGQVWRRGAP